MKLSRRSAGLIRMAEVVHRPMVVVNTEEEVSKAHDKGL